MAFTSRAIRQTGVFKTATPKEVGPGSYDFALSGKAEQVRGRAPFSSTAERQLTAGQPEHVTPGPGSYIEQSKPNASAQASSNTFVNRVKRFGPSAIEKEAVPGPGSYNRDVEWVKNGSGSRVGGQGGPATESSVVWFRNPSAPSIPTHAQSFGYEQGGDGRLVRQGAPPGGFSGAPNDAAGPGDYENTVSALTERTTSWAKSNVPRQFVKETKTPGPGHYAKPIDTMGEQPLEEEEPPVGLSSFTSKVSRGLADGQKTKKKNQSPGPGAYNPPSMFNSQQVPENLQVRRAAPLPALLRAAMSVAAAVVAHELSLAARSFSAARPVAGLRSSRRNTPRRATGERRGRARTRRSARLSSRVRDVASLRSVRRQLGRRRLIRCSRASVIQRPARRVPGSTRTRRPSRW